MTSPRYICRDMKKKDGDAREDAKKNDYRATIKGDSRSFAARWMDIKKTMNVAIERVHDLLTKGTGAARRGEIRRTRGREDFRGGREEERKTNFRDISLTKLVIDVLFVRR